MAQWLNWRGIWRRRKEKVEITIETRESWEVQCFRQSQAERCPICRAETIFIPPEIAAQVIGSDDETVRSLLESGRLHGGAAAAAHERLICLSSLKKAAAQSSAQKFLKTNSFGD